MVERCLKLRIVTYNIMTPVMPPVRFYGQRERAERVVDVVKLCEEEAPVDVLVLNEVIPGEIDATVTRLLAVIGFKERTPTFKDGTLMGSSGVILFSRHRISQAQHVFYGQTCAGVDCLCSKGVVYARLLVQNGARAVNVFSTHMQAWPTQAGVEVRRQQVDVLAAFMKKISIPEKEPILLCGDLNMDLYTNNADLKHLRERSGIT